MAKKLRYLILAAIIAALGLGAGFAVFRAHLLKRPELLLEEMAKRVDLSLDDIDYTQISGGRKQWSLKAERVEYEKDKDLFSLRMVEVVVFRSGGKTMAIRGDTGLYSRKEGWINIQGQARLSLGGGFDLVSESFRYQINEQVLTSQSEVNLSGPGVNINARGLRVDMDSWKAVFLGGVASEWDHSRKSPGV